MNRQQLRRGRVLAVSAAASLVLAGVAFTAPPASAAPFAGTLARATSFSTSGGGCAASSPGVTLPNTPFVAGAPVPLDHSGTSTVGGPTVPDVTALSAAVTGTAVAHETAGSMTDFDVNGTLAASANRALGAGSACTSNSSVQSLVQGTFTLATAGVWDFDVSVVGTGLAVAQLQLQRVGGSPAQQVVASIGQNSRNHALVSLGAGDYVFQVQVQAVAQGSNAPTAFPPATNAKFKVRGAFHAFGSAKAAAAGTAKKYVALADGVACGTHSVTADFTNKAGKKPKKGKKPVINKATFFVNGAKVKSVKKPNKNTLVTLSAIPDDEVTVSAQLKLGGGKGTVTVERSYLPCS